MQEPRKAFLFLACPELWPRPINGSGHFRELCDVTMRHLAGLCNFGTLCPEIKPCPMAQPQPLHALPRSCKNPEKHFYFWRVPNSGPAPKTEVDISGSCVTSLRVTWQCYVILGHCVPKLTLAVWLNPNYSMHFHAHAGTQKSNPDDFTKTGNSSHCHGTRQSTGGERGRI